MLSVNLRQKPAWKHLDVLEAASVSLFLGFYPIVGMIVSAVGTAATLPVAALYGGFFLYIQRLSFDWKCPRCGMAFLRARGRGFARPFRQKCGNCKLPRGCSCQA